MAVKLSKELDKQICDMIMEDKYSDKEIAYALDVSQTAVLTRRHKLLGVPLKERERTDNLKWLQEHWCWDVEKAKRKGKYRKVKIGSQGRLRTPYRPDGKFL